MFFAEMRKPAWRNGLARWTSNPKVVGSNPTVGAFWKNTPVICEERKFFRCHDGTGEAYLVPSHTEKVGQIFILYLRL